MKRERVSIYDLLEKEVQDGFFPREIVKIDESDIKKELFIYDDGKEDYYNKEGAKLVFSISEINFNQPLFEIIPEPLFSEEDKKIIRLILDTRKMKCVKYISFTRYNSIYLHNWDDYDGHQKTHSFDYKYFRNARKNPEREYTVEELEALIKA